MSPASPPSSTTTQRRQGNLKAVVKAILLDDEARSATVAASASVVASCAADAALHRARAWGARSSDTWQIGDTSSASTQPARARCARLGVQLLPPRMCRRTAPSPVSLVAPEFQNQRRRAAPSSACSAPSRRRVGTSRPTRAARRAADDAVALVARSTSARQPVERGDRSDDLDRVATIAGGSDPNRLKRIYASLTPSWRRLRLSS
jgi:hypothetical protein